MEVRETLEPWVREILEFMIEKMETDRKAKTNKNQERMGQERRKGRGITIEKGMGEGGKKGRKNC